MTREFFEREENSSKLPLNWKSFLNNYEVENADIGNSVYLLLMANKNKDMKFPDDRKNIEKYKCVDWRHCSNI